MGFASQEGSKMAEIAIINPRFEVSYWGMEHALPLLGKRPTCRGSTTLGWPHLTPGEHEVILSTRRPGARFRSAGSGGYRSASRHERAAVADARDPDGAEKTRGFHRGRGPWV